MHNARRAARYLVGVAGALLLVVSQLAVVAPTSGATTPPATQLAFTTGPSGGSPGIAQTIAVSLEDSSGHAVTGDTSTVSLTLNETALSGQTVAGTLSCAEGSTAASAGGTALTSTASAGVATFSGCSIDRGGLYSLSAADSTDNLTATSSTFFVSGPAQLVLVHPPGDGTAGTAWGAQPEVQVEDANGNVIPTDTTTVGVAIVGGTGTPGAALSCTTNPEAAASGVASFSGCSINEAGSGYELYAIDPTDELISAPSSTFSIGVGAPSQIVFSTEPIGGQGGSAFSTQPTVSVEDAGGNVIAGNSDPISLALTSHAGTAGTALTCTKNPVPAVNGVATFSGCSIDKAGGYTLTATDSAPSLTATSTTVTISAGAASQISFMTGPSGGSSGGAFSTQPAVSLTDAGGNPVSGPVTLSIAPGSGSSGAVLTCTANPVTALQGVATFSGCGINLPGTYALVATSGSLSTQSAQFGVSKGTASQVAFATDPAGSTGGVAFPTQPVVDVRDAGGSPAAGSVTLSLTPGMGSPGAKLACDATTVAAIDGVATFRGCAVDRAGTGYRLTATLSGSTSATAISTPFAITTGPATRLVFVGQPASGTGGAVWSEQPAVAVEDAGGNRVTSATPTIALSIASGTGSGTLSCPDNPVRAVAGIAEFAGCSIDKTASAYELAASDSADGLSADSAPFAVTTGAAAKLVFTQQPVASSAALPFTTDPQVTIEDKGGNPVTGDTGPVALAITPGTGTAGATLTCDALGTRAGVASFSPCSIDEAGGGYTLTATASTDQLGAESLAFSVPLPLPDPLGVAPTGIPTAQTFGARLYANNPTDTVDDVNTATGALSLGVTDLRVAGIGEPLVLARTYNSLDQTGGSFGPGWSSLLDLSVVLNGNQATVRGADGQQVVFTQAATAHDNGATGRGAHGRAAHGHAIGLARRSTADHNRKVHHRTKRPTKHHGGTTGRENANLPVTGDSGRHWTAPPGAKESLVCGGMHCKVTQFDGVTWTVHLTANGRGELRSFLAPDHQGLRFDWSDGQVTITVDSTNETPYDVVAQLNPAGEVTSVTTPAGRHLAYGYDAKGLLTSVTDVLGNTWRYGYSAAGLLQTMTDPTGSQRLSATYDATGKVASVSQEGSAQHTDDTFTYVTNSMGDEVTTRSALQDAYGTLQAEPYVDTYHGNVLIEQSDPSGATTRYSYDDNVDLTEIENPLGWVQRLRYDAAGDLVSQSNPISSTASATTTMTYDHEHRITSQSDANGNVTRYVYEGPFLRLIEPPGTSPSAWTRLSYNGRGELVDVAGPLGQKVLSYDAFGSQDKVLLEGLSAPTSGEGPTATPDNTASPIRTAAFARNDKALLADVPSGAPLNGSGTTTTYDEAGNRVSSTDPLGRTTRWSYDDAGNLLSTTTSGGDTTRYAYDPAGDLVGVTDPQGKATTYAWDEATLTRTTTTSAGTTTQVYDPSGDLLEETNPARRTTSYVYDAAGRQVEMTSPSNVTTTYAYDLASNLIAARDSAGDVVTRQYDALGRQIRTVVNGAVTLETYDPAGNVTSATDPSGATTTWTYNDHNKIASVTDAAGTTTYAYDAADDLTEVTAPDGSVTTYTYDGAGRKTSKSIGGSTWTYGYDAAGHLTSIVDPTGRTTTYTLDALNRPVKTVYSWTGHPSITTTQTFDAAGQRTQMTDPTGTHTYTYDAAGNLTSATLTPTASTLPQTFSYDYSHPGEIIETYPDGTVIRYHVDDAGSLMSVSSGTPGSSGYVGVSYILNAARQTTGIAYSNGVFETQTLDGAGNVTGQTLQLGGSVIASASFGYGAAGNPTSQTDTVLGSTTTSGYGYDASGRLNAFSSTTSTAASPPAPPSPPSPGTSPPTTNASPPSSVPPPPFDGAQPPTSSVPNGSLPTTSASPPSPTYAYDGSGNRLTSTTAAGTTTSSYNGADELTSSSGPNGTTSYAYDAAGNLTSITGPSGTESFSYNAAGELSAVTTASGTTVSYTYDGNGNRVTSTVDGVTTDYLWDPSGSTPRLAIEQHADGSLIRRYFYGNGPVAMQTPSATYFYHLDPVGSVAEISSSAGKIVAAYHYDAFGNVTTDGASPPANPLLFQGQYLDATTGLYDMHARNYDPTTGRFTQRDPAPAAVGSPAVSPYVFVGDQPTTQVDPTGRSAAKVLTKIFWGQSSLTYNVLNNVKYGLTAIKTLVKVGYIVKTLDSAAVTAASEIAPSTGEIADATSEIATAGDTVLSVEGSATLAAEAGPESEALSGSGDAARFAGPALAVVGLGLQTYVTVETCMHGTAWQCAGDVVGTALAIGFTVGCEVATEGVGSLVCALAGAAISAGMQYLVTNYGPTVAAALVSWYGDAASAVNSALPAVTQGLQSAANAVVDAYDATTGAIATGLNEAGGAISSGFDTAISTLVGAGLSAAQLADVLAGDFNEGVDQAVNALIGLGYDAKDIAGALVDTFQQTAQQAAQVLKGTFDYTVDQVAGALKNAYQLGDQALASALKGASYGVDQVASALESAYGDSAQLAATALQGAGYAIGQITSALQDVYQQTDKALASTLQTLGYTADEVAGALKSLYGDAGQAAAAALQLAGYAASEVAGALDSVYQASAQVAASILSKLSYTAGDIAGALDSAYQLADLEVGQILKNLGYGASDVAQALVAAYQDADWQVANVLEQISYGATDVATALTTAFSGLANEASSVAALLQGAGYPLTSVASAIGTVFSEDAAQVAATLASYGNSIDAIATAIGGAFSLGAQDVAKALLSVFNVNEVAGALQSVYQESAQGAAQILENLGQDATAIAGALKSVFNESDKQVASTLKAIGETASSIATAITNAFDEAAGTVASVLSDVGFSTSTIDAIGGAFSSFGQSVSSGVHKAVGTVSSGLSSGWNTVSSWF